MKNNIFKIKYFVLLFSLTILNVSTTLFAGGVCSSSRPLLSPKYVFVAIKLGPWDNPLKHQISNTMNISKDDKDYEELKTCYKIKIPNIHIALTKPVEINKLQEQELKISLTEIAKQIPTFEIKPGGSGFLNGHLFLWIISNNFINEERGIIFDILNHLACLSQRKIFSITGEYFRSKISFEPHITLYQQEPLSHVSATLTHEERHKITTTFFSSLGPITSISQFSLMELQPNGNHKTIQDFTLTGEIS